MEKSADEIRSSTTTSTTTRDEEEEEEQLVLIQFTDIDDANYCQHFSVNFKSIDIQSENPIIQIGDRFYSGEYTNNIGTYLFFEQTNQSTEFQLNKSTNTLQQENIPGEAHQQSDLKFNYSGKSFKRLVLSRLFIEEKKSNQ